MDNNTQAVELHQDHEEQDKPRPPYELLFADDQCLIHRNKEHLQDHINELNNSCMQHDMKINIEKTEILTINAAQMEVPIKIDNQVLKDVKEFKYLGSIFTSDGKLEREIETRIQQANKVLYQLSPILKHPAIQMHTKKQLINTIFIPTLCYQCQTWTLTKCLERKLACCEMRCLRKAACKTRRDMVRNTEIRKMVGTTPVDNFIKKQRMNWFGHLIRMNPEQPAARAYHMRSEGTRRRGRPRRRWTEGVVEILCESDTTIYQETRRALDRRPMVKSTCNA